MNITFENVKRVYSGKTGCMCGCIGTYKETERSKKIVFNKILKGEYKTDEGANCVYLEKNGRTLVAYFN